MEGTERALLYATAIQTGLRSGELASLTRGKLQLTAESPFIVATAKSTKNKKLARQYINLDLAAELQSLVSPKLAGAAVFNMPSEFEMAAMIRSDLVNARAAWLSSIKDPKKRVESEASDFLKAEDSQAERIDFHALRHTCASWLIQSGADIKTVQSCATVTSG